MKAATIKGEWRTVRSKGGSLAVWPSGTEIAPSPKMAKLSPDEIQAAIDQYHEDADTDALASLSDKTTIDKMGYAEIERLRDAIFRRAGKSDGISKRTANNYWNEELGHTATIMGAISRQALRDRVPLSILDTFIRSRSIHPST